MIKFGTAAMTAAIRHILLLAIASALLVVTPACGQWRMVDTNARVREHSRAGHYQQALSVLQERKQKSYKQQDAVLYWMNEGMLLHLLGRHRDSIAAFHRAERRSEQLFTRSISRRVQATFTSDGALDYQGDDHEKVLLNVFKALNFLAVHDREGALVEARKINRKLAYFNTVYKQHQNSYREDAFAHWLMGILFEIEGSLDDARIAYEHAYRVYRGPFGERYGLAVPDFLAEDLARAAEGTSETERLADLRTETMEPYLGRTSDLLRTHGEIILIHLNGEGPEKTDQEITCGFQRGVPTGCDHEPGESGLIGKKLVAGAERDTVTVAFPKVVTQAPSVQSIALEVGARRSHSQVVLPINWIAEETMRDKLPRVFMSAVLRAVAKASSRKAAAGAKQRLASRDKGTGLLGAALELGTDVATSWTEEADKRTWTTLPGRIEIARLWLPAGTHELYVRLPNGEQRSLQSVRIVAGQRVFLTHRTM